MAYGERRSFGGRGGGSRGGYGGGGRGGGGGFRGGGGRRDRDFDTGPKPVKNGDEYDVKIEEVGSKGDGIARVNNFVVFVPGTNKGDNVRIRITEVKGRFAIAEVVSKGGAATESESASEEEEEEEEAESEAADPEESEESEEVENAEGSEEEY